MRALNRIRSMTKVSFRAWGLLIGAILALSLTVVLPIHLHRRLPTSCNPGTGLRAAHHAVIDRAGTRVGVLIDLSGHAPGPDPEACIIPGLAVPPWSAVVPLVPIPRRVRRA